MSSVFCGKFIKGLKSQGWTQKAIAELLGITQQHCSRLANDWPPSIEIVLKLADHFAVSTDEVLGRTTPNKKQKAA